MFLFEIIIHCVPYRDHYGINLLLEVNSTFKQTLLPYNISKKNLQIAYHRCRFNQIAQKPHEVTKSV